MAPILANEPNNPFAPADPAVAAGTRGGGYSEPAQTSNPQPNTNPAPAPATTPPADQTPVPPSATNGNP
jgi:hypothetical protein